MEASGHHARGASPMASGLWQLVWVAGIFTAGAGALAAAAIAAAALWARSKSLALGKPFTKARADPASLFQIKILRLPDTA